ncbi:MAG: MurR/RpiR family transcriptional regulator [Bacillota bacterium]|nr:MurR/RpiR family transcriptional regulator [Bacillota bacterium]MDP4169304.1 MurR/RpiR family transcriptional regulator [Bacillota bacterium]
MTQNCLGTIRSYYAKLSEKEKTIADYILKKPEIIIHRTINEVADDLNIADATVFRFSKRMGFKGFQAMKIALASEIMTPIQHNPEGVNEKKNEKTLPENIFNSTVKTLQNTLKILDINSFKKATELILQANRVEFYGTGGSSIIAMDAFYKFVKTEIKAFAYIDSHIQLLSASQLSKSDVAIIISHSGSNKVTMDILNTINETGAKTIGITSVPRSPISLNVDVALYTGSEESDTLSMGFSSQIAQISLINALCLNIVNLKQRTPGKVQNAISNT